MTEEEYETWRQGRQPVADAVVDAIAGLRAALEESPGMTRGERYTYALSSITVMAPAREELFELIRQGEWS